MTRAGISRRLGKSLRIALAASAAAAVLPAPAIGQQTQPPASDGPRLPPQLRDFQLEPQQRLVTQPRPAPQPQPTEAQPAPAREQPAERTAQQPARPEPARTTPATPRAPVPTAPAVERPAPATAPVAAPEATAPPAATALPEAAQLPTTGEASAPLPAPVPAGTNAAPAPAAPAAPDGMPLWLILVAGLGLGLGAYAIFAKRRSTQRRALTAPEVVAATPQPQAPRVPRPDPVPRPWLDIELTAERTTADPDESVVEFELRIHNKGGSTASDIRLQAKLFCSTPDQDKQITEFHRKKPGDHRTLSMPDLEAGQEITIKGSVDIKRDQIKLLQVENRLLFIPLIAVNAFYGWGSARTGQTSKSFLVGRETAEATEKMAPFRMDLGPRVYRTVGQRPYAVERRV